MLIDPLLSLHKYKFKKSPQDVNYKIIVICIIYITLERISLGRLQK